jgi:hypothetical protein
MQVHDKHLVPRPNQNVVGTKWVFESRLEGG